MDIIVTPASDSQTVWSLTDRLGRTVGRITQPSEGKFIVVSEGTRADPLSAMDTTHTSLGEAMDAIAIHLKGVCQLAGGKSSPSDSGNSVAATPVVASDP